MRKLDLLDRRILLEMDTNARASFSEVGKKLRIGKSNVQYRLARMIADGVIKKFSPMVSNAKLGFMLGKFFLQLSGFEKVKEEEFYRYLMGDKRLIWIAKCEGRWDLMLGAYVKDISELDDIKWDLFERFERYINSYDAVFTVDAQVSQRSYLVHMNPKSIAPKQKISEYIGRGAADLDMDDKRILLAISNDARYDYADLGKKLGLNPKTIQKRIRRMEDIGVINGYVVHPNLNALGIGFYKVCIYLKDYHGKYDGFVEHCLQLPNVVHVIETLGPWDVELELETESVQEFYDTLKGIRNRFSDIIKKTEFVIITDEMKLELVPQILVPEQADKPVGMSKTKKAKKTPR